MIGNRCTDADLTRQGLARACADDIADDDFGDVCRVNATSFQRAAKGDLA
jgi:hypothetical protein